MKKICDECLKEVSCSYHEKNTTIVVDNVPITYLKKFYVCDECGNEFLDDYFDYDIKTVNSLLREHNDIITTKEIEQILEQYNIGKKPLSLILGLGEVNIIRYLNGSNPTKDISDLLKNILNNPVLFEFYLFANKDKITEIAYKKSLSKTKQLEFLNSHSKLYNTALYIIQKLEDIDALSLQKLLYFANGFSNELLHRNLFQDLPMAWKYGPVYSEIYDCFSYYKGNKIDYSELLNDRDFGLYDDEKKYLDFIIRDFGCYSGSVLREMSHLTSPWINSRVGLGKNDSSTRIIEQKDIDNYFKDMCKEYKISSIDDISKYSLSLFEKAKDNLF